MADLVTDAVVYPEPLDAWLPEDIKQARAGVAACVCAWVCVGGGGGSRACVCARVGP